MKREWEYNMDEMKGVLQYFVMQPTVVQGRSLSAEQERQEREKLPYFFSFLVLTFIPSSSLEEDASLFSHLLSFRLLHSRHHISISMIFLSCKTSFHFDSAFPTTSGNSFAWVCLCNSVSFSCRDDQTRHRKLCSLVFIFLWHRCTKREKQETRNTLSSLALSSCFSRKEQDSLLLWSR